MRNLNLVYDGTAPIPKGTKIKVLVDNPNQPAKAYQIKDLDNNIEYSSGRARAALGIPADFIFGIVKATIVYAEGKTLITVIVDDNRTSRDVT